MSGSYPERWRQAFYVEANVVRSAWMSIDDSIIDTPDGPMTWAEWKKKHPIQIPSRRTRGKKLPVKVKRFTSE